MRQIAALCLILLTLAGCSDGGSSIPMVQGVTLTQPDPNVAVSGGGVKGPLVNADATLYLIDLSAADLKGTSVSTGTTNNAAALTNIIVPANSQDTYLLEITANESTVDLNSGLAPILTTYQTIVTGQQIRDGEVYATPITTLAISVALQSAPFADLTELNDSLTQAARQVISSLGFGLDVDTNPFTSNPLLTASDTSETDQQNVLAYRVAIEDLGAVLQLIADEADSTGAVSADTILTAVAEDLSDGAIDGQSTDGAVTALTSVTNITSVVTTDPATLIIPGTERPITEVAELVVSETSATGVTVTTSAISSGEVAVIPVAARTEPDSDGDGVPDIRDALPNDATETVDTDGDGIGNNSDTDDDGDGTPDSEDAFPLNRAEQVDTDADGIGNNEDTDDDGDTVLDEQDAFPLNEAESVDTDADGIGNNSDTDDDGDGTTDSEDAFPLNRDEQTDTDLDGIGNNTDDDDDGDGVADENDDLPLDPRGSVGASETIGVDGGTITSPDGTMSLVIPAGALFEDTAITIGTPTAAASEEFDSEDFPLEGHYLLLPSGTQFSLPVQVTWSVPESSSNPRAFKLAFSRSEGIVTALDDVSFNPDSGEVSATLDHFTDLYFVSASGEVVIGQPQSPVGGDLVWEYEVDVERQDIFDVFYNTEGAFRQSDQVNKASDGLPAGITVQPELLEGEGIVTAPTHVEAVACQLSTGEEIGSFITCATSDSGSIKATCLAPNTEETGVKIGFNVEYSPEIAVGNDVALLAGVFSDTTVKVRVEARGLCFESVEITEPSFIPVGQEIDRITEASDELIISECSLSPQPYYVVVSNTQTSILDTSGNCSRDLQSTASDDSKFGGVILTSGDEARLFEYGEFGVFAQIPENDVFGQLFDFTSTTTDGQFGVDDEGARVNNEIYTCSNDGVCSLYTLGSDGVVTGGDVFNAASITGGSSFIGYAPITSTSGIGITTGSTSEAYYVYHGGDTPTGSSIGTVGDTALGISCSRLLCEAGTSSCSVSDEETVGCSITSFESEELRTLIASGVLTERLNIPTFNFTTTAFGVKTASPFTRTNANGDLVTATVNDNEVGKVRLSIDGGNGNVQEAEFFLPGASDFTSVASRGKSIVLIEPSAEYPNGAVRIAVEDTTGDDDGVLTVPITEELLGTDPEPFFGARFSE